MDISEQIILTELNKIRRGQLKKDLPADRQGMSPDDIDELLPEVSGTTIPQADLELIDSQEREILRLLLNFGNHDLHFYEVPDPVDSPEKKETVHSTVKASLFMVEELERD